MITLQDLEEAIAECQGERNPNANTCIKLAAYYTIREQMFPHDVVQPVERFYPSYSNSNGNEAEAPIMYNSGSEFSDAIQGLNENDVLEVMDELMEAIQAISPKLYVATIDKLLSRT